ncbi:helix-turn-helix domain-containing protein [Rohdeia mirabilis]
MSPPPDPRDFDVLTTPEQIASLAHADRLAILGELVDAARTGSQVAERLGLPVPRAHYHLARLVKDGLVVEVGLESKRFVQERFYRAVARHHLVYPHHAGVDQETGNAVVRAFEEVFGAWRRRAMLDIDLGAIARRIAVDALRVRAGERVLIFGPPQVQKIADMLFVEIEALGGRPTLRPWSREYIFARLERMDDPRVRELPFMPDDETDALAGVVIVTSTQPSGAEPTPEQRKNLPHLLSAHTTWLRRLRELGVRQVELSVPVRGDVDKGELSVDEALALFWRALAAEPDLLERRVDAIVESLGSAQEIELRDSRGGQLRFAFDDRLLHRSIGRLSDEDLERGHVSEGFPAGSLLLVPLPGTANGSLHLAYTSFAGVHVRDVELRLEHGRIVGVEAPERAEFIRERLASAVGDASALAHVRFGVNPAGHALTGKASLDSILEGAVTLGFGSNESIGGSQSATLDLRFPSRDIEVRAGGAVLVPRPSDRPDSGD